MSTTPRIFISYSHRDREWRDRLLTHLSVLKQEGLIAWSDEELRPGDDWPSELREKIDGSDIAVLLLSANFLASGFISEKEMPALLERRNAGATKLLPLVVTPCSWELSQQLKGLEVRPKDRTVQEGTPPQQESDFAGLTREIARLLTQPATRTLAPPVNGGNGGAAPTVPQVQVRTLTPALARDVDYAILEIQVSHQKWNRYLVELSLSHSGAGDATVPLSHSAQFDLGQMMAIADPAAYAQRLRDLLFTQDEERGLVRRAHDVAGTLGIPLRVRVAIDPSARELHLVRWELLGHGAGPDNLLSFESTSLLRYAGVELRAWRDIEQRPQGPVKAMLMAGIADWSAACVRPDGEDPRARELDEMSTLLEGLGCTIVKRLGYVTADSLRSELRSSRADLLYACLDLPPGQEGPVTLDRWMSGLQDPPFAEALRGLEAPPRLVVVSPAFDEASSSAGLNWGAIVREADEVAQAGVTGVVTAQAHMPLAAWRTFVGTFVEMLKRDGRMDVALQTARQAIPEADCAWRPVLISGLRTARMWYRPQFTEQTRAEATWQTLLKKVADGACTPVIGPALNSVVARSRADIALALAERYHYPMAVHERVSLPQVTQYIASVYGEDFLYQQYELGLLEYIRKRFGHLLGDAGGRLKLDTMLSEVARITQEDDPDEPHSILARLPFPLYVTAGLNSFLTDALKQVPGKTPQEIVLGLGDGFGGANAVPEPSVEKPLIFQLFGRLTDLRNSVITEDNYFDFLIRFWKEKESLPSVLRAALTNSSLLFLGFKMDQWDLRVLFRSLLAQEGAYRRGRHMHVAVQVDPDDNHIVNPERARHYLAKYFAQFADADISLYWGSAEDFLRELRAKSAPREAQP
jgi:hypothetical protein